MTELLEALHTAHKSYTKIMQIEAIWIHPSIRYLNKKSQSRFAAGDRLKLDNGNIVSTWTDDIATHLIISCHGNVLNTTLFFKVRDITTGEESEVYVAGESPAISY